MDGNKLQMPLSHGMLSHWKVHHPFASNNIIQMRSAGFQPTFDRSGQISYFLGKQGNNPTHPGPGQYDSPTQILMRHYC
jgi:hypothetical protein